MTLYLFHGKEDFLIEKEIGKLKNKLLDKSFISMSYKTYSKPSFPDLMDILNSQPMMFGNSLAIVECNNLFESALEDKQLTALEQSLQNVPAQINIVFLYITPRNDKKKIDTRTKIYKILSRSCEVQVFEQLPTYDKTLPTIIAKLGKENELIITPDCAAKIIEMVGSNLRIIDNELKKIKMYIHPQKTPTPNDIEKICTSTQDVFKLIDYFILSNKSAAMKELDLLSQTQHPLKTLASLQTTLSRFITIKLLSRDLNTFEISRKLNMHEYRVKLELEKVRTYKYDDLLQLKKNIVECEYKIKTGQIYTDKLAIEQLILNKAE